jgi:hypothetical protein
MFRLNAELEGRGVISDHARDLTAAPFRSGRVQSRPICHCFSDVN